MRSSTILTLIGATLAVASPVHHNLHKKAIIWDVVTDVVYVTVTEGDLPSTPPAVAAVEIPATTSKVVTTHSHSHSKKVTTTSIPPPPPTTSSTPAPPPPAPTTSSTPAPAPTTSEAPATTEAPAPAPTTSEVPAPAPVSSVSEEPASSSEAVAAPAASPSDLASTAVYYHSAHRANHSASAVTWDQQLADYAAKTAATCVFAHDMSEGGGGYGQNIDSVGYGDSTQDPGGVWEAKVKAWDPSAVLANAITNDWYLSEVGIFNGDNSLHEKLYGQANPPQMTPEWTHFSQIVWKSSLTVGCAVQYCGSGAMLSPSYAWYTVCNYGPAGNYLGEFATEVTQSIGNAPVGVRASDGNFGVPTPWEVSS